ncbi:hypothetical protein OMO38_15935 [Chryseobacterium sp. 09-1422]|uniref:Leucine-rich repeat domain-containing protein n=1 Tax=Chryseobacterium kimseyorum TaxID=2984028 RepID=A0ABT3I283_9FLAO|nr:hypothetical protein [Chryseobacterium kimseyorum]MCW3170015.1 hypothetical protein [Chryseobacterium kimseyorum]
MDREKPINISLTSTNSHIFKIPPGQGSFSIGLVGMDKKKFDVLVEKDLPINWNAFDEFTTPAGGHWPRFFYYWGNDIGFIEWSEKRAIEDFFWFPTKELSINLTNVQIRSFSIEAIENPIKLILGNQSFENQFGLKSLNLSGNIENFEIIDTNSNPYIRIEPITQKGKTELPYKLPTLKNLETITSLDITVEPLGQPFDCESLLQFPNLKNLNLTGNITNVNCLSEFLNLERLGIRYAPNLENFPSLNSWKNLKSFIGWNIDEITGKSLNTELKQLTKVKELDYSSVSKLRSSIWFTTEYGIPFTNWETKNAKIATKAYKTALKEISKAKTENEVKTSIVKLVEIINKLPNIETVEREDSGTAIIQLVETSKLEISHETANNWFDEIRDF